jgi:hypothetical protein
VSTNERLMDCLGRAYRVAPMDRAIALWDGVYRRWHRLDAPSAQVPPVLCLAVARAWRLHHLCDGTAVRRGDRYGELHLDNAAVLALRQSGLTPMRLALMFRHELRASLATLARLSLDCDRVRGLVAFSAVTIFEHGLARLGFDGEDGGLLAPRVTGAYQHALLASLAAPPASHRAPRAHRMWISRRRLRALYGPLRRVS